MQTSRHPFLLMEIPAHSSSPGPNQETAHLRAVSLVPGLSLKGGSMKKSSAWKMVCIVFTFCVAAVIASPAQTLTTLHNFAGPEGATPSAPMVLASDGNFYGTTIYGGAHSAGAVFKITPSGTLSLLYSFCSVPGYYGCADGNAPLGMVQGRDGNFYGVADQGGELNYAGGTIFRLTPSGALTTLYSFCGIADCTAGQSPTSIMQASDGNLYGVMANAGYNGFGDFYQLTTSGTFTELYDFDGSAGKRPSTPLVQGNDGNLYGTAPYGGAQGYGTVFKMTLSGTPTLLYSFCSQPNCTDGSYPGAGLVKGSDGNFYGTTSQGGANDGGEILPNHSQRHADCAAQLRSALMASTSLHRSCKVATETSTGLPPRAVAATREMARSSR